MIDAETEKFKSNIGSPQGDGSSGKFFDIYFQYALRKVRQQLDLCPVQTDATSKPIEIRIPEEAIYADDADFITLEIRKKDEIQYGVKDILEENNLFVNETKTEITKVGRKNRGHKKMKVRKKNGEM